MVGKRTLLCALALACVCSTNADEFERSQQLAPGVRIAWTIDKSTSTIKFSMSAESAGWVGFGIGEGGGMKGSDIVYFESGTGALTDAWADGHRKPMPDSCQDWTLIAGGAEGGTTWFEAERALETPDTQDWALRDDSGEVEPTRIIAAWGPDERIQRHLPDDKVFTSTRFFGAQEDATTDRLAEVRNDPDVKSFEFTQHQLALPEKETYYHHECLDVKKHLKIEDSAEFHIVGVENIGDPSTTEFVHHFIVSGFNSVLEQEGAQNSAMCNHDYGVGDHLFGWAPGQLALSFPPVAGAPLLGKTGYRSIQLQTHFNNPLHKRGKVDSSGIRVFYTTKLRQFEVGVVQLGDPRVHLLGTPLPKGDSMHRFDCGASFTNQFQAEEVTVFTRYLHMHGTGRRMETRQYRDGSLLRRDQADWYDFNMNGGQIPKTTGEGFTIRRGDSFETDCYYRTPKNGEEVVWGLASDDEMCIDFVFYYPRENLDAKYCSFNGSGVLHGLYETPRLLEGGDAAFSHAFGKACEARNLKDAGQSPQLQIFAVSIAAVAVVVAFVAIRAVRQRRFRLNLAAMDNFGTKDAMDSDDDFGSPRKGAVSEEEHDTDRHWAQDESTLSLESDVRSSDAKV